MSDTTPIDQPAGSAAAPDPSGDPSTPAWVRESLSKANNEAAKYRTELRTMTDQHTAALSQIEALSGEKDAAVARVTGVEKELLRLRVALSAGVPGDKAADFAALLQGDDEDALKAHAESVKGLFGTPTPPAATDPSQGRGEEGDPSSSDPSAAFAAVLRSQLNNLNR